jgi:hypothetical protein
MIEEPVVNLSDSADGRSSQRLDGEVARRDRIQRVAHRSFEPEFLRGHVPVDWEGRAGQRCRTQRILVHPPPGILEALAVARQHFHIGKAVVAECHRLRRLQMSEARHDHVGMLLRLLCEGPLQCGDLLVQMVDRIPYIKPEVGRHLVVA